MKKKSPSGVSTAKKFSLTSMVFGFVFGAVACAFYFLLSPPTKTGRGEVHMGANQFINPLIDCASQPNGTTPSKAPLKSLIQEIIDEAEEQNDIQSVGVYYRDLNNGPVIRINTDELYAGASLMKMPFLIGILKKQMANPGVLQRSYIYKSSNIDSGKHEPVQTIAPPDDLVENQSYTVDQLIRRMIVYSDNHATTFLHEIFPEIDTVKIMKDMGIPMIVKGGDAWFNVEDYASVLRILYNATFLDDEHSNLALSILSQSAFKEGLLDGIDTELLVAHKFGERGLNESQQFHHCGIIYYPQRPYILCVMTKGTNQNHQIEIVGKISRAVLNQVKKDTQ